MKLLAGIIVKMIQNGDIEPRLNKRIIDSIELILILKEYYGLVLGLIFHCSGVPLSPFSQILRNILSPFAVSTIC
jgi:hypothetical protein